MFPNILKISFPLFWGFWLLWLFILELLLSEKSNKFLLLLLSLLLVFISGFWNPNKSIFSFLLSLLLLKLELSFCLLLKLLVLLKDLEEDFSLFCPNLNFELNPWDLLPDSFLISKLNNLGLLSSSTLGLLTL